MIHSTRLLKSRKNPFSVNTVWGIIVWGGNGGEGAMETSSHRVASRMRRPHADANHDCKQHEHAEREALHGHLCFRFIDLG